MKINRKEVRTDVTQKAAGPVTQSAAQPTAQVTSAARDKTNGVEFTGGHDHHSRTEIHDVYVSEENASARRKAALRGTMRIDPSWAEAGTCDI